MAVWGQARGEGRGTMSVTLCTLDAIPADQANERADPPNDDGTSSILPRARGRICACLTVCPGARLARHAH